jgi:hypothetical protein
MDHAEIQIVRESGFWRDRHRTYEVPIDRAVVGALKPGDTQTFVVATGTHEVALKVAWFESESISFDIGDGQTAFLRCWPAAKFAATSFWWPKRWIGVEVLSAP